MRVHNIIQKVITPIKGNAEYDLFIIYVTFFQMDIIFFLFFPFIILNILFLIYFSNSFISTSTYQTLIVILHRECIENIRYFL